MRIAYANSRVGKFFTDYGAMKKKLPISWVRTIKKHIDRLEAAEKFGDFLRLRLGRPELLQGYLRPTYSVHVTGNVRLILELNAEQNMVILCQEVTIEGVSDYHGGKENWYIS